MSSILERLNLKLNSRVTNGKGNIFRVVDSKESRIVAWPGFYKDMGPSILVKCTSTEKGHFFWIDETRWISGEWFAL